MATNPNNIVRIRARNNGRASVYEANAWCQAYSEGLLSGVGVIPNTSADMNVLVGGSQNNPDIVIAANAAGFKVALDLVGQAPIAITAPASSSRVSSVVVYSDDLSLAGTDTNITGSPNSCGLIVVNGPAAASPDPPSDAAIRSAITADGATGSQAVYGVIANITVESGTTSITSSLISPQNIVFATPDGSILPSKINYPIGKILILDSGEDPNTTHFGTWQRIANGRTLVGVNETDSVTLMNTSGQTGGSTNPLTSHSHTFNARWGTGGSGTTGIKEDALQNAGGAWATSTGGSNTNHANWQPFYTVYLWKRVS
jgi:hypothetical protein